MMPLLALSLATAAAQDAEATTEDTDSAGVIAFYAEHLKPSDPSSVNGITGLSRVGVHGYQVGFDGSRSAVLLDGALGYGWGGGMASDFSLQLGVGGWAGERLAAGLTTGIGLGGVWNHIPAAFRVPIRATALVQLAPVLRTELYVEPSWIPRGQNLRKAGGVTVGAFDEWRAGLLFYTGRPVAADADDPPMRFSFGVTVEEVMGTRLVGGRIQAALVEGPFVDDFSEEELAALLSLLQETQAELAAIEAAEPPMPEPSEVPPPEAATAPSPLCDGIVKALDAAAGGFKSIESGVVEDDKAMSTVQPFGEGAYIAQRLLDTPAFVAPASQSEDPAEAEALFASLAHAVGACTLPGSWVRSDHPGDGLSMTVFLPFLGAEAYKGREIVIQHASMPHIEANAEGGISTSTRYSVVLRVE